MADGNGAFAIITIVPGIGFITQNDTILHMNGSFGADGNGISCPIIVIPCRIDLIPDGNAAIMDGVAVQAQGKGILFHIVAVTNGDTVISISIIRIGAANGVVSAQSQGIGPGHRIGIAEYGIIIAFHGIIGTQYMGISCFRLGAAVLLLAIHAVTIADCGAFICTSCIIDPQCCRIVPISAVGMADGRAGVFGLVVLADSHAHVVGHTIFSDGHAVFLGVGLVPNGYSGPAFSGHIAAYGHGIGRVDETGDHIISIHKCPIRGIVSLSTASDMSLFIQPIAGILLIAGQFPISIHVVAANGIQDFGLVADGRGMISFGHIVHAYCRSPTDVIGLASLVLAVIIRHIIVDLYRLTIVFIRAVIAPFRIFGPDVILVIHVLAWRQFIDFHLLIIIFSCIGIIDLYRNPFRIQLLIGIGIVPADGLLGFRGMGEFAHAVAGPHDHIFRFIFHTGIAGLGVFLDGDNFIVLAHDQIALGIISSIGT